MTPSKLKFESQMDTWINGFLTLCTPLISKDKGLDVQKFDPARHQTNAFFRFKHLDYEGETNFFEPSMIPSPKVT